MGSDIFNCCKSPEIRSSMIGKSKNMVHSCFCTRCLKRVGGKDAIEAYKNFKASYLVN